MPAVYPATVAKMLVTPVISGVIVTVAVLEFAGTVTLVGIEITLGSNPEKLTVSALVPAGGLTVTVRVPGAFSSRFSGLGASVTFIVLAVIDTVTGELLRVPLFTINCATYVPETSARKLGVAEFAFDSVAVLP